MFACRSWKCGTVASAIPSIGPVRCSRRWCSPGIWEKRLVKVSTITSRRDRGGDRLAISQEVPVFLELSDELLALQETCREFAAKEVEPVADQLDRESKFPLEIVRKAAELGLLGLCIAEEYGA